MLEDKLIKPPYVPETECNEDVSNIDDEFLQDNIAETPAMECELTKMINKRGEFDNFSFVAEEHAVTQHSQTSIEMGEYNQS
jgi:hypothetical protein